MTVWGVINLITLNLPFVFNLKFQLGISTWKLSTITIHFCRQVGRFFGNSSWSNIARWPWHYHKVFQELNWDRHMSTTCRDIVPEISIFKLDSSWKMKKSSWKLKKRKLKLERKVERGIGREEIEMGKFVLNFQVENVIWDFLHFFKLKGSKFQVEITLDLMANNFCKVAAFVRGSIHEISARFRWNPSRTSSINSNAACRLSKSWVFNLNFNLKSLAGIVFSSWKITWIDSLGIKFSQTISQQTID